MIKGKVCIVLTTYNGEQFLTQQIESIINQTYSNWELLVRDDCSVDSTVRIVQEYVSKDGRIKMIDNENINLKACQNFSKLMEVVPSDSTYVMFCDQDDIWFADKVEKSVNTITELEVENGSNQYLLAYSTYNMMDENGNLLPLAIPDYSTYPDFKFILSQNYIYGCTMIINKKLLESACPIPLTAENHDYWIVLTALANNAFFKYINEPLLFYRQHSNNVSGSYTNSSLTNRIKRLFNDSEIISIKKRVGMYISLIEKNSLKMSPTNRELLGNYIQNVKIGGFSAFMFCYKNNIARRGKFQTLLFYFNLFRTSKF